EDKLKGTPAVQLYSASNPAFQSAMIAARGKPDDLVFVVTHDGCEDHNGNQVIAYYASDLTERWRFNSTGSVSMDSAEDGCEINYGSNVLYVGTNQATPGQNTLWAIQSLTGSLQWATPAGPIESRPVIEIGPTQELYVASPDMIQKRDASSGALIWAFPTGSPIVRGITVIPDPLPAGIYYTTTDGLLHGIMDNFPAPVPLWPPVSPGSGIAYTGIPVVLPGPGGQAYIGRSDGFIQQVSVA